MTTPTLEKLMRRAADQERRIRELEAELAAPAPDPCIACEGYGTVMDPGYYVSGEQFVEPPHEERCGACVGSGRAEIQHLTRRIAELEHVAADLEALLAASGPEISHDDVARILAQALKKQ